eukprot:TRINITY_DN86055_c0_g1_i1.p3 TRINITY_DN86055_c0_g1~~TRINITY_DN86055_c0_g1_i1.p3  ORF type:complete len:133 (+),score=24.89 TRINITY_DN86055_c0_g1_i1:451-849(+)
MLQNQEQPVDQTSPPAGAGDLLSTERRDTERAIPPGPSSDEGHVRQEAATTSPVVSTDGTKAVPASQPAEQRAGKQLVRPKGTGVVSSKSRSSSSATPPSSATRSRPQPNRSSTRQPSLPATWQMSKEKAQK